MYACVCLQEWKKFLFSLSWGNTSTSQKFPLIRFNSGILIEPILSFMAHCIALHLRFAPWRHSESLASGKLRNFTHGFPGSQNVLRSKQMLLGTETYDHTSFHTMVLTIQVRLWHPKQFHNPESSLFYGTCPWICRNLFGHRFAFQDWSGWSQGTKPDVCRLPGPFPTISGKQINTHQTKVFEPAMQCPCSTWFVLEMSRRWVYSGLRVGRFSERFHEF